MAQIFPDNSFVLTKDKAAASQRRIALHVIGLDHKRPFYRNGGMHYKPYRNRFCGQNDYLDELVDRGLMTRGINQRNGCVSYSYNRAGLDWLGYQLGIYIYDCKR